MTIQYDSLVRLGNQQQKSDVFAQIQVVCFIAIHVYKLLHNNTSHTACHGVRNPYNECTSHIYIYKYRRLRLGKCECWCIALNRISHKTRMMTLALTCNPPPPPHMKCVHICIDTWAKAWVVRHQQCFKNKHKLHATISFANATRNAFKFSKYITSNVFTHIWIADCNLAHISAYVNGIERVCSDTKNHLTRLTIHFHLCVNQTMSDTLYRRRCRAPSPPFRPLPPAQTT